jgi:hypothetical protein
MHFDAKPGPIRKFFEVLKSGISSMECYIPVIAPPKFPDGTEKKKKKKRYRHRLRHY